jgi:hypothetical protein
MVVIAAGGEGMVVAKKKVGRPKGQTEKGIGIQARIDADLVKMGRMIAPSKGITLTQYLSEILRPAVVRDYHAILLAAAKSGQKPKQESD